MFRAGGAMIKSTLESNVDGMVAVSARRQPHDSPDRVPGMKTPEESRSARRRALRLALVVLAVSGFCFGNSLLWAVYNSSYAAAAGCRYAHVSPSAARGVDYTGPGQPYGAVLSCRMVSRRLGWFGVPETSSSVLLLLTQRGMVLIRLDYRDVQSRRMTVKAVELPPEDAPSSVTRDERDRLRRDVAGRGGVRPGEWVLVYGDG